MRTRRAGLLSALFLLLACGTTLLFVFLPRETLLRDKATRIADTKGWDFGWTGYHWINNRELLFCKLNPPEDPEIDNFHFYKHDVSTGKDTYLAALTRLMQHSFGKHSECGISPDGQRLLWTGPGDWGKSLADQKRVAYHGNHDALWSATLEGEQPFLWRKTNFGLVSWMSDSRHLVEYTLNAKLDQYNYETIYDIENPKTNRRFAVLQCNTPGTIIANNHLLVTTGKESDSPEDPIQTLEVSETEAGQETPMSHKYLLHLPFKAEVRAESFAPSGEFILLALVQEDTLPPLYAWLHRCIPAFKPPSRPKISFWVSRLDSGQMREVGYLPLEPDTVNGGILMDSMPVDIQWTPDGKRLSFKLQDALYTVPID